jgi:hypothetical protein
MRPARLTFLSLTQLLISTNGDSLILDLPTKEAFFLPRNVLIRGLKTKLVVAQLGNLKTCELPYKADKCT